QLLGFLQDPLGLSSRNDSSLEYMDQVQWTSMANFYNNSDLDPGPIGLLPIHHQNFSSIIRSVVSRNSNVTFRYYDYNITNHTDEEVLLEESGGFQPAPQRCPGTFGATTEDLEQVKVVGFLLDVICQSLIGVLGMVGNLLAIYILVKGKKLQSNFNKILTCLLAVHSIYILNSLTLEVYKKTGGITFDIIFSNILYPCKPMLLYTSTLLTMFLTRERYLAIRYPIEYRNAAILGNRWRNACSHLGLCVALSAAFVVPLVFESEVKITQIRSVKIFNETHSLERITHHHEVRVTDLRVDRNYVFWYKNIATFTFTVAIPLGFLIFWNSHTILFMRRRLIEGAGNTINHTTTTNTATTTNTTNTTTTSIHNQPFQTLKTEEANKIRILFVILLLFFVCNTLRFFLIFEECVANRDHKFAEEHHCVAIPFWVLIINRVSQLFLTINASLGAFVYCVMSIEFRIEVIHQIKCIRGWIRTPRTSDDSFNLSSTEGAMPRSKPFDPPNIVTPQLGEFQNPKGRLRTFHQGNNSLFFENRCSSVKIKGKANGDPSISEESIPCVLEMNHYCSEPKFGRTFRSEAQGVAHV
ncbi:hypothetical protein TCAL_01922, partial [Tigriopus californicus]